MGVSVKEERHNCKVLAIVHICYCPPEIMAIRRGREATNSRYILVVEQTGLFHNFF